MKKLTSMKKSKNILDYIHGMITFDLVYFKFIDSPQFQRLRDIKQLSTIRYLFPSANHNKLEHSFGVCFLANKYAKYFHQNQRELEINDNIIRSISLAGLCSNLGSSPYSEPFSDFCKEKLNFNWNQNEYASIVFNNIIETKGIDPKEEDFDLDLINRILNKKQNEKTHWTEQIVNNTKNGIDVNLFDSLIRDVYKLGFPNQSYDYQILMNNSRVINDEICYRAHDAFSIDELFTSRYCINKKFYSHRMTKGIELMIKDIFYESSGHINYLSKLYNMNEYIDFTNNILNEIMQTKSSQLIKAKELISRIDKRDFYIFAGEYDSSNSLGSFEDFNENTLLKYTSSSEACITVDDIRIVKLNLNLGINNECPIKSALFYDTDYNIVDINREQISNLLSNHFQEMIVRIYVTSKNEEKISAAQKALINYCKEKGSKPLLYKTDLVQYQIKSDSNSIDSTTNKDMMKDGN